MILISAHMMMLAARKGLWRDVLVVFLLTVLMVAFILTLAQLGVIVYVP